MTQDSSTAPQRTVEAVPPSRPLRIGVIGAGIMGSDHSRAIAGSTHGAVLEAVADIDLARAQALAAELGAPLAVADPLELIAADAVDAVVVASHDSTHTALVLAAIAAGKPVLCEKPLALDLDDCARIIVAEREAGRRLVSVGFSRRFDPALVELKQALDAGEIGRPLLAHAVHRNVSSDPSGDSASTVLNSAIHELDQTPWLLSAPVAEVSWHAPASTSLLPQRQDPQLLLLRTADGALTTVEVFVNAVYGYDVKLEVVGETGTLAIGAPTAVVRDTGLTRQSAYPADWRPRYAAAYRAEMQQWVDAVTRDHYEGSALASAVDGYRATAVAHAVIAAMETGGRSVAVAYPHAEILNTREGAAECGPGSGSDSATTTTSQATTAEGALR
ncbi:Gfo/Idh/MocA family oxidoreductase [Planctomonas sp. JC2975]|uniref:Gfo/Idh/MocA family protein n=1 Tax=Planctomonas sp. JC2975 TaxID=2729626 RepID=UPI0014735C7A|nr:Gfo/Idh/MocA family oxidoreductase [Planctomonas sp. JC2975]NNC11557.1 Gfo/Idh/MocA family oxidoreductase [Planctomonas sp. JC2975]